MSELATTGSRLPDLYRPQSVSADLDGTDIVKPKLKIGQYMSPQVQEGLVKAGSIFTHLTEDDAETIIEAGPEGVQAMGLEFYVLGVRKGKSISEDGELRTFAFNDPNAPEDAWITYTYTLAIPTVDSELPYQLLLTRTSIPAARQLNLLLKKYEAQGGGGLPAFVLKTKLRQNTEKKYKWFVAQVSTAPAPSNAKEREARETNQRIAASLTEMVAGTPGPPLQSVPGREIDEPSI